MSLLVSSVDKFSGLGSQSRALSLHGLHRSMRKQSIQGARETRTHRKERMFKRLFRCEPLCQIESQASLHEVHGVIQLRAMIPARMINGFDNLMVVVHCVPVLRLHSGPLWFWDIFDKDVGAESTDEVV